MIRQVEKYLGKLRAHELADPAEIIGAGLDAEIEWSGPAPSFLAGLFDRLPINALLAGPPAEPFRSIIAILLCEGGDRIRPRDTETRTFLHDIPVVRRADADALARALSGRKGVILEGFGLVTTGTVTVEQAFVTFSSLCHALFVRYFDAWPARTEVPGEALRELAAVARALPRWGRAKGEPARGPFVEEEAIYRAVAEAGRRTVEAHLVDSFFGNVSYVARGIVYISQTGSSLDELKGTIDPVPLDGSSSAGITASTELAAHRAIYERTGKDAILHGHPKFACITSMICEKGSCPGIDCARDCREPRRFAGIPVVSGEIGAGGLAETVPEALGDADAVMVYGHGVFTAGRDDFRGPFRALADAEDRSRRGYFLRLAARIEEAAPPGAARREAQQAIAPWCEEAP